MLGSRLDSDISDEDANRLEMARMSLLTDHFRVAVKAKINAI